MADGLGFKPRVKEPESSLIPGMATPAPRSPKDAPPGVGALSMPDTSGPPPVAIQAPANWVYDFDPANGLSRATFNGEVSFLSGGSATAGVTSWNTRTGAVTLAAADLTALGAVLNPSPALNGTPTAPTPAPADSSTKIATTAFVAQAITANPIVQSLNGRTGAVVLNTTDIVSAGGAPLASPAFTGTPTTTTPTQGDASGKVASTQFVANAIASGAVTSWNGRQGAVTLTLSDVQSVGGAPIASPTFTGVPAGTTANPGTSTTQLATCAFVTNAVSSATAGVASWNTRTGAVTLQLADVTGVGGAPILSPTFTGTPAAPTPTAGDSSTKLATTAFVGTAISNLPAGVSTFNGRAGTVTLQAADVTDVGGALLASPSFTGSPTSTTGAPGDNSTRIATDAFVAAAIAPLATAASVPGPATVAPVMDGTAAVGTSALYARQDHVHPTDTSRAAASALAGYLPLSGGTITGATTLNSNVAMAGPINYTGTPAGLTGLVGASGAQISFSYNTGTASLWWYLNGTINDSIPYGYTGGNFYGMTRCGLSNSTLQGYAINNYGNSFYFALTSGSDRKLKTSIRDATRKALDHVKALHVCEFDLKQPGREQEHWDFGLIADEVEGVVPRAFVPADPDQPDSYQTLRELPLVAMLVKAVQELSDRVERYEARIGSLEAVAAGGGQA